MSKSMYNSTNEMNNQFTMSYQYDSIGNILNRFEYNNGVLIYKTKFEYNSKGETIKERVYTSNNELTFKKFFEYNEQGNLTEQISNSKFNGVIISEKKVFEYDSVGNCIKTIVSEKKQNRCRLYS